MCQLMEKLRPKTGNSLVFCSALFLFLFLLCPTTDSKNLMMEKDHINFLHKTKVVLVSVAGENIV